MSTAKDELTRLIQDQPEDSSSEDIVRTGSRSATSANDEMGRRIRSWQP